MSSSDYIQKVFSADEIASSTDLGQSSTQDSNRNQVEIFIASEAISAGDLVSLDLAKANNGLRLLCVKVADGTDACPVGVAVAAAAADAKVEVVIKGIVEEAKTKGDVVNIAVGDALIVNTAGKLHAQAVDEGGSANFNLKPSVAVALEATTADGTSRVYIMKNF